MDEPVKAAQGTRKDRRKGGTLTHDVANHTSLAGSGAGLGSAHGAQAESGGDRGPKSLAAAQGTARDYIEDVNYANDPAGVHGPGGSGETKDKTEFGQITTRVHQGNRGGAEVDSGAMEAWGGMQKRRAYSKEGAGEVDIEKPGYPMQGEPASGGGPGSVKGSVDGSD